METPVIIALIGATGTALGWLATHVFSQSRDRVKAQNEAALRYIERQLEELYGPLTFYIREGRREFLDLLDNLGRDYVFPKHDHLPDDELKMWLFWAENAFIPRNQKIQQLLMKNTHLIDGSDFPDSYIDFLDHHNSWEINHLLWKNEGVPYSWRSKINWPESFERDILCSFAKLKRQHSDLLGKIGSIH
jgi:hypothetical protein